MRRQLDDEDTWMNKIKEVNEEKILMNLVTALHCITLHHTAQHCTTLHHTTLNCTTLHCTAPHCTALHCWPLNCICRDWPLPKQAQPAEANWHFLNQTHTMGCLLGSGLCALYILHCSICSVQCSVCSVQYAVCSVQCAVCSVQCAVCSVQCAVCNLQCAVCSVQFVICSVQCAVCSWQLAVLSTMQYRMQQTGWSVHLAVSGVKSVWASGWEQ